MLNGWLASQDVASPPPGAVTFCVHTGYIRKLQHTTAAAVKPVAAALAGCCYC